MDAFALDENLITKVTILLYVYYLNFKFQIYDEILVVALVNLTLQIESKIHHV
jgi:hypothetical protein